MSRQTNYTNECRKKEKFPEISRWISGKIGDKTFVCKVHNRRPLQLGNVGIKASKTQQGCCK